MATRHIPTADLNAVRAGDSQALVVALIALADRWLHLAGSSIAFPVSASEIAAEGGTAKAGLLAAAVELRELVAERPDGLKALGDFGFEPRGEQSVSLLAEVQAVRRILERAAEGGDALRL